MTTIIMQTIYKAIYAATSGTNYKVLYPYQAVEADYNTGVATFSITSIKPETLKEEKVTKNKTLSIKAVNSVNAEISIYKAIDYEKGMSAMQVAERILIFLKSNTAGDMFFENDIEILPTWTEITIENDFDKFKKWIEVANFNIKLTYLSKIEMDTEILENIQINAFEIKEMENWHKIAHSFFPFGYPKNYTNEIKKLEEEI